MRARWVCVRHKWNLEGDYGFTHTDAAGLYKNPREFLIPRRGPHFQCILAASRTITSRTSLAMFAARAFLTLACIVAPALGTRVRPVSRLLLSRAERTLDDFDVWAFAKRLAESIPTLDSASFVAQRPRRCGGVDRVATVLPRVQTGELTPERGRIAYKEVRHGVLGVERFGIGSSGSLE